MKKVYSTPVALCQRLEEKDIVCLSVGEDKEEGFGALIPLN